MKPSGTTSSKKSKLVWRTQHHTPRENAKTEWVQWLRKKVEIWRFTNTCDVHMTVFLPLDFPIASLHVWLYQIHELIFHQSAFHSLDFLVALEYYNCRKGSYFEFARPIRVLIRVDLGHADLVTEFSSHLTNSGAMSLHGSHHVAKTSSNKGVAESVFNSSASCKSVSSPT